MKAVLHGGYVDYVMYLGMTERYPQWFEEEVLEDIVMDESRYTFWMPSDERSWDYHDKTLVETDSVFLRKATGEIFCTSQYVFHNLYDIFIYIEYSNHGVAAFQEDTIEYVECQPGVLSAEYPDWFYEFFTESVNIPGEEAILLYDTEKNHLTSQVGPFVLNVAGDISIDTHCVFLRNLHGEIRHMEYSDFLKHYNPGPTGGYDIEY